MELKLAENIKRMRKERSLTQEALANALGVTVGAVYKWEANLSSPELEMLVRIADLFDTSVDTLLGYEMADKRKGSITEHIYGLLAKKDRTSMEEAEKALIRYPNDYSVILAAANTFSAFGSEDRNKDMIKRSIALYEKALCIVPFDCDPRYGRLSIIGNIALLYFLIDDKDKALSMMSENNEAGVFNSRICLLYAMKGDTGEECYNKLISSFSTLNFELLNVAMGLLIYYKNTGNLEGVKTLSRWCIEFSDNTRKSKAACYYDKIICACLTAESYAYFKGGDKEKAGKLLSKALKQAKFFDSSEEQTKDIIKLFDTEHDAGLFSIMGSTGIETIESTIELVGDRKFTSLWNSIRK